MSGSEGVPSRYFEEKPVCRNRILNDKNRVLATIRFSRYYAWHLVTSFGTLTTRFADPVRKLE